jgi:hypothetical protein
MPQDDWKESAVMAGVPQAVMSTLIGLLRRSCEVGMNGSVGSAASAFVHDFEAEQGYYYIAPCIVGCRGSDQGLGLGIGLVLG